MATLRTFSIKKLPKDHEFRGQQKLIVDFMQENPQSTILQITDGIKGKLETRQAPDRVVAFYMSVFKKKGWIVEELVATEAETTTNGDVAAEEGISVDEMDLEGEEDEETEEVTEAQVDSDDAASTGANIMERMEAMAEADLEAHAIRLEQTLRVSVAVLKALTAHGEPATADDIVTLLGEKGYEAKRVQVVGALSNLMKRGVVRRSGTTFELQERRP